MAMVDSRLQVAADNAAEQARLLRKVLEDGRITPDEMDTLQQVASLAALNAYEIQDAVLDQRYAMQVLRMGRERTPNNHLAAEMADMDQLRADVLDTARRTFEQRYYQTTNTAA